MTNGESERKVSRLTRFHSNVGKTFTGLTSFVLKMLKKAIAHKIHRKTFVFRQKPQNFSPAQLLSFTVYLVMFK